MVSTRCQPFLNKKLTSFVFVLQKNGRLQEILKPFVQFSIYLSFVASGFWLLCLNLGIKRDESLISANCKIGPGLEILSFFSYAGKRRNAPFWGLSSHAFETDRVHLRRNFVLPGWVSHTFSVYLYTFFRKKTGLPGCSPDLPVLKISPSFSCRSGDPHLSEKTQDGFRLGSAVSSAGFGQPMPVAFPLSD